MRAFLGRNWFVLSLPAALALAWAWPEAGATGGWLRSEITTRVGVALIFLLQGLTLPAAAMRAGLGQWRLHAVIQGVTFLLFPLLGLAFDAAVGRHLAPDLRTGFLYLCVLPSTVSTSVVLTTVAGGNAVGAVFNAVLSSLLGLVVTPLWVAWLMKSSGRSQPLGPVVAEICLLVLAPLVVGQLARLRLRAWADARKKWLGHVSSGVIVFIVFAAFCNSVKARTWSEQGVGVLLATLLGTVVLFLVAWGLTEALAAWAGLRWPDRVAAAFCGPQKTLASGVPLAKILFGAHPGLGLVLLPLMFYHPLQLVICGVLADRWKRLGPPADGS